MPAGRSYGAEPRVKPMRLAVPNAPIRPAIATVAEFKTKPSPTVPAASSSEFCVQKSPDGSAFLRFKDPEDMLHGSDVNVIDCVTEDTGLVICTFNIPGTDRVGSAPLCEEVGANKEPISKDCCVKLLGDESGQIVCAGAAYDLLIVRIISKSIINDVVIASVEHPDLPGGGARLPICESIDEAPDERPCCVEEESGLIVCPEGVSFPLNGMTIPLELLEFVVGEDGQRLARLRCGDIPTHDESIREICTELGGYIFHICARKKPEQRHPERRPEGKPHITPRIPDLCCVDPDTGKLVCEGTRYHDLSVSVLEKTLFTNPVTGMVSVSVEHPLLPGGGARLPLCPRIVPNDGSSFEDNPFDEEAKCRDNWDKMIRDPAKYDKCDKSWLDLLDDIKSCRSTIVPGRRGAAMIKYANMPGLRGGAWKA